MTEKRVVNRTIVLGVGITLLFLLLMGRLFWIQSVEAAWLHEKASSVWNKSLPLEPKRGTIFDRNGKEIANNAPAYTVAANPMQIENAFETASKIAPLIKADADKLEKLFSKTDKVHVEVRPEGWKISKEIADQITALELPGIFLVQESKRYYPNEYMASHVTGYVSKDNEAVGGLESYYDDILRGTPGSLAYMRDRQGNELPEGKKDIQPATHGKNLVLTIDSMIQHYVEKAMDEAIARYNPKNMTVIVADPNTMEILAMGSRPSYNPNEYWNPDEVNNQMNQAISSRFEPGSTFKIVTLAAAIEEKQYSSTETFQSGSIKVPGRTRPIRDWNNIGWGEISFLEGVWKSSNVAFIKLGFERLGKEKLFSYIDKFGFNAKTGIDLPGEIEADLFDVKTARDINVATTSFGQGVAVTPIQQLAAVAAIANGGKLMKPYVVKEVRDMETGKIVEQNKPTEVRRVVSEDTSAQVRDILEGLVENGAPQAYIEEFRVAGKTGTAQKVGVDGQYLEGENIVSFVGFAPANKPELLIYVAVDAPNVEGPYYGSTIAAPIFKDIMQNSLRYLKVPVANDEDSFNLSSLETTVPEIVGASTDSAVSELSSAGLQWKTLGNGDKVNSVFPAAGSKIGRGNAVIVVTEPLNDLKMPDLTGYSLKEALDICEALGLKANWTGVGFVTNQTIPPESIIGSEDLQLKLQPLSVPLAVIPDEEASEESGTDQEKQAPSDESDTKQQVTVTSTFE